MVYKRIEPKQLTGDEPFINTGSKQFKVQDFWSYAFSNLNSNVLRGALAEFLVENALKDKDRVMIRNPWGDFDVLDEDGTKIEVKCCAYIQDWDQNDYSKINFSGLKAKPLYWSEAVQGFKEVSQEKEYKADVYILALLMHKDHKTLDILDLDQWAFYVLSKDQLSELTNNGNSVSGIKLEKNGFTSLAFAEVRSCVDRLAKNTKA